MPLEQPTAVADVLDMTAALPEHVVHRSFVSETVVLNLRTGKYHGMNLVAGRMLTAIERSRTVGGALEALTDEFDAPADEIERDLRIFCKDLAARGLIELGAPAR
jgi:hypothetical protein